MKNVQKILNAVLSKNIIEYILIDRNFVVTDSSKDVDRYLEKNLNIGDNILSLLPEFIGAEEKIEEIFLNPALTYVLESVHKNDYYVNICAEHYDSHRVLVLIHNITQRTVSQQKLLQYSNESTLISNTLQKILDNQNALLFVTNKDDITYANEQFMHYFGIKQVSELKGKNLKIYKYLDADIKDYCNLFEYVNNKEEYITIGNDTFIIKSTRIEDTHQLFTMTKVTQLAKDIQVDTLTGIYKKGYFNTYLERLIRKKTDIVVVVLDIDDFKKINDTYGHQTGDNVLMEFASLIQNNIRENDLFARWGGEEFLMLLENATVEHAMKKVELIRELIDKHTFKEVGHMTASFGLAKKEKGDDIHSLLFRADKALYEAKDAGKNRLVFKKA